MIAEKSSIDGEPASEPPARMQLSVEAGETARFDTVEGKALEFACKPNAQAMTAATIDRVALYPAAE